MADSSLITGSDASCLMSVCVRSGSARRLESAYARRAGYLHALVSAADHVWVMGYIARNALACQGVHQLRENRAITPPYFVGTRFFVSRSLSRASRTEVDEISHLVVAWLGSWSPRRR
jgi:hypothetical protein